MTQLHIEQYQAMAHGKLRYKLLESRIFAIAVELAKFAKEQGGAPNAVAAFDQYANQRGLAPLDFGNE